jgi:hypothetical protein
MKELNEAVKLLDGPLALTGPADVGIASDLAFQWTPSRQVVFNGVCSPGESMFRHMDSDWELRIEGADAGPPVVLIETTLSSTVSVRGIVNGSMDVGASPFERLRFSLANFPSYIGDPTPSGGQQFDGVTRDRLHGSDGSGNWTMNKIPVKREVAEQARSGQGFVITHVGEWSPVSGSMTPDEATSVLTMLLFWFGLLRGAWSGPILPQGLSDGRVRWRRFAPWMVNDHEVGTWMPSRTPLVLTDLYAGFACRWRDERWHAPLRMAIWWLVQANAHGTNADTAIILAQVALELLAWVHVVEVERLHSRSDFEKLSAAGRLRALLQALSVPAAVPGYMSALSRLCDPEAFDGPGVITRVRNALVHASEKKRALTAALDDYARYECSQLALQYVELVLLAICGYQGHYAQRAFRGGKGDHEVLVPWAVAVP